MNQDTMSDSNPYFISLILNFQTSCMIALGKIKNPFKNEITRNLQEAKHSIDMLEMLENKTRGNLTEDEKRLLQKTLTELRLNYVDELNKDKAEQEKKTEKTEKPKQEEKEQKKTEKKEKSKKKKTTEAESKKKNSSK